MPKTPLTPVFHPKTQRGSVSFTGAQIGGGVTVTVTINQAVGQDDPTSATPILFDVVFSEPVTGFSSGDVTVTGTAGATTGVVSGSGDTYTVSVSGVTGFGTVIVTVPAGAAMSSVRPGILNEASTSTDNEVTFLSSFSVVASYPAPPMVGARYSRKSGDYVFVNGAEFSAWNVSDPADPTMVSALSSIATIAGFVVDGNYAYVAQSPNTLHVVDISDPANMVIVGSSTDAVNLGNISDVCKVGNLCYVACYSPTNRLTVVNVATPASPVVVGSVKNDSLLTGANTVVGDAGYAYVNTGILTIVDVTPPSSPTIVGFASPSPFGSINDMDLDGTTLYAAIDNAIDSDEVLAVFDVADRTAPTLIGSYNSSTTSEQAWGVAKSGNLVYMAAEGLIGADFGSYVLILNVSEPTNPTFVARTNMAQQGTALSAAFKIINDGDYCYVVALDIIDESSMPGHLAIVDVSTPAAPFTIGHAAASSLDAIQDIYIDGDWLYAVGDDGLAILDITNPAAATIEGALTQAGSGIVVDSGLAYVTVSDILYVYDVASLLNPNDMTFVVGSVDTGVGLGRFVKDGNYLYITLSSGLMVVNVTTPASPSVAGSVTNAQLSGATGIVKDGNLCYVACSFADRLTVVDVTYAGTPTIVGSVQNATLLDGASGVVKDGNHCFVACAIADRVTAVDVSTPSSPVIVGSVTDAQLDGALLIVKIGNECFVAAFTADRVTGVDVTDPTSPTISRSIQDSSLLDGCRAILADGSLLWVGARTGDRLTAIVI